MSRNKTLSTLAAIFVAGVLVPVAGHAQTTTPTTAEELEQRAASFKADVREFGRIGDVLVKAASLRADTDPVGLDDLFRAAGAYYTGGQKARARTVYEQTGDRALAMGDVSKAASSYVRAAIIANEQHDAERDVLIGKANRLAASPLLTEAERQRILGQFTQPVRVAAKQ